MPTLQQTIAEAFLADLVEKKTIDDRQIEDVRKLLAEGRKVKADDFVKIFTGGGGELA
jgi:hypothetical protein